MKLYSNIIVFSLLALACTKESSTEAFSNLQSENMLPKLTDSLPKFKEIFNGIYIEAFDSTLSEKFSYDNDNQVYKVGSIFRYSYFYQNPGGKVHYFKKNKGDWQFVSENTNSDQLVKEIVLKVVDSFEPNYPQTKINYYYPPIAEYSSTGVIENKKNIWLHPPRDYLFRILELNPFPYVKQPYKIGNKWNWEMEIGSHWSDSRWMEWANTTINFYEYEITDKKVISTELGKIECLEIKSRATSELGSTSLTSYFNFDFGFVKLLYSNIDDSKIEINLISSVAK